MSSQLEELVSFLHSPQPPARQIALENVAPLSYGQDHAYLFKNDDYRAITDLKILCRDKTERTAQLAISILVNICDSRDLLDHIASDDVFVEFVAKSILTLDQYNADLLCMLLANLAKNDNLTKIFEWKIDSSTTYEIFKSPYVMDCLLDCFVNGSERKLNKFATFDYLAFFFADISRFSQGRKYFVTPREYDGSIPLSKLTVFTETDSLVRRRGIANTIKNALFEVDAHMPLVEDDSVNLLVHLLLPLAGPEDDLREDEMFALPDELQLLPPDKKRDPDADILRTHVESLLLLSTTKPMREHMRDKGVYGLVRVMHLHTDNEELQDACDRLVQMLMRDEAPEEIEEEEDDAIMEVV